MYGLEAVILDEQEMEELEAYHRKNLRHIQHLPRSTANAAIYLLSGIPPIQASLEIKTLTFMRTIIAADTSIPAVFLRDLITRQAAMKDIDSHSWDTTSEASWQSITFHRYTP